LRWDVSVWDAFLFTDQRDVSEEFRWVHINCENNELSSAALGGLGHFIAALLQAAIGVGLQHVIDLVRYFFGGFKSHVYTHWISLLPHVKAILAQNLADINTTEGRSR
jgi:hypothetical protein